MFKEFLEALRDYLKEYIKNRLFPFSVLCIGLFVVLVVRLFQLQIVDGREYLDNFTYKQERTISVPASRGNIYDCNGNSLAYNEISYTVTFGNSPELESVAAEQDLEPEALKNQIVYDTICILESNGDHPIYDDFPIRMNESGEMEFTVEGNTLTRFRMEVYGLTDEGDLKSHKNETAREVFEYLRNNHNSKRDRNFDIADSYTDEEALKIMAIRYSLWLNRFQQYVTVKIALNISDESAAQIIENKDHLLGMDVQVDSTRVYNDAKYFANIIGYIGNISVEEMEEYNANLDKDSQYLSTELVGKMGIEHEMESSLRGKNGNQHIFVDNMGRVLETISSNEAVAGNDVYLTIDSDLQKYCYHALEKELSGILLAHISDGTSYGTEKNILIPINDVYFALFNNNTLRLDLMKSETASEGERNFYNLMCSSKESTIARINGELNDVSLPASSMSEEDQELHDYIYHMLIDQKILDVTVIQDNDETFQSYKNGSIGLSAYLQYAINQNAVNIDNLEMSSDYYDSDEIHAALVSSIVEQLAEDAGFEKMVVKYMIWNGTVSGTTVCMLLYDQGVLPSEDPDYEALRSGAIGAYGFMRRKIEKIEITPAQLALDPCSGTVVITDVNTGDVKALVVYPSYDNNRLTNKIDADYYNLLNADITSPMYNRATMQKTAPGSTYKMLSSVAGVQEGVLGLDEKIEDRGIFDKITPSPRCWIYPGNHGTIGIPEALEVSCNYFYYEVGYRLGTKSDGTFSDSQGLTRLNKYTEVFGLDRKSGIELPESEPNVSDESAPRSAIGQGSNSYAPVQLARYVNTVAAKGNCYDLTILKDIKDYEGNSIYTHEPTVVSHPEISSGVWNSVHDGMRRVITNNTPESSLLKKMNVAVAGKTGTAQEDLTRANHALFVSFAPYDNPEITVTTVIPYGYSSGNAQELASFIYAYYYQPELLQENNMQGDSSHID